MLLFALLYNICYFIAAAREQLVSKTEARQCIIYIYIIYIGALYIILIYNIYVLYILYNI